jgi:hypothetical protein
MQRNIKLNLFILDEDAKKAAQLQCDKHVVKMILESAQILSTAHRVLDGIIMRAPSKSGKTMSKHWIHPNPNLDSILYKAVHVGHPCTVWTMQNDSNYIWHWAHFKGLCEEYTYRYGKVHSSQTLLLDVLHEIPKNIPSGKMTKQPLAMQSNPECINKNDIVGSYRSFYQTKQERFRMAWTKREVPEWFQVKVA